MDDGPQPADAGPANGRPAPRETLLLGLGLVFLAIALCYLWACFWPSGFGPGTAGNTPERIVFLGTDRVLETTADVQLLLLVMVAGALGSFLHTAKSFADFVGNEKLARSWFWWYILKPFIGAGLALIFYVVMRAGFLSTAAEAGKVNVYGIAGLAALAGMFSKQATDKLGEVFDTLFRTAPGGGDDARKGELANEVPVLTELVPARMVRGTADLVLQVHGAKFVRSSAVQVGGATRQTVFRSETVLETSLLPEDVAADGELVIAVVNPPPGGGQSTPLKVTIAAAAALSDPILAAAPPVVAQAPASADPHAQLDACGVQPETLTRDEDLPPARGGVAS